MRLEPLTITHAVGLLGAATEDRSSYDFTWVPRDSEDADAYIQYHLSQRNAGGHFSVAIIQRGEEKVIGHTAVFNPRSFSMNDGLYAVEIGYTWLSSSAQGSGMNVEAKSLLCEYAFQNWGLARVDFKTDARNARSRSALASFGAQFEGVLRSFGQSWAPGEKGRTRDSAMFSIVASDWPELQKNLAARLPK